MKKLAIVRGKFLNAYEMQIFEPLSKTYDMTAFGSNSSYHNQFAFPVITLSSPMDLPEFPYKLQILNRIYTDAHYLYGLEEKLQGFDIVHTAQDFYHYTQQALNAKKKGYVKKVVATILENIPFNNEGIWGRKQYKQRARNELDHMIALTKRTRDMLYLEGADSNKITVISHGINIKRFYPKKNWLKNEYKKTRFTILFSGRLEMYKGVYEILYAAKLLLMDPMLKKYSLHFQIVGEGSEKEKMLLLEKKLQIEKYITHTTLPYSHMPNVYQQADLFWAPSKPTQTYQEQYCTALLEAQASGLPIVTTFCGGIPENIGDAGVVIGSGDFYSLREAMKEFILYPEKRIRFAKRARKRAEAVHDVTVISKHLDALYKSLL